MGDKKGKNMIFNVTLIVGNKYMEIRSVRGESPEDCVKNAILHLVEHMSIEGVEHMPKEGEERIHIKNYHKLIDKPRMKIKNILKNENT